MIGAALETLIISVMTSHIYEFKIVKRLQLTEGATGLNLTGELADLIMLWWDMEFMKILSTLSIEVDLYGRFKDDGNLIVDEIPVGTIWNEKFKELVYLGNSWNMPLNKEYKSLQEIYEQKMMKNNEEHTMAILVQIANSIEPMINFTADFPSNHQDLYLPVLDIKVKLDDQKEAVFNFYEKEMKSKRSF